MPESFKFQKQLDEACVGLETFSIGYDPNAAKFSNNPKKIKVTYLNEEKNQIKFRNDVPNLQCSN